jgi:hypothetical protein
VRCFEAVGERGQAAHEVESGEAHGDADDREQHGKRRRDRGAEDEEQYDERDREADPLGREEVGEAMLWRSEKTAFSDRMLLELEVRVLHGPPIISRSYN